MTTDVLNIIWVLGVVVALVIGDERLIYAWGSLLWVVLGLAWLYRKLNHLVAITVNMSDKQRHQTR